MEAEATECSFVLPELGNNHTVKSPYNSATRLVVGSLPPFADIRTIDIADGRFYNWADVEAANRVAVLGSDVNKQLYAARKAVGDEVLIQGIPYRIVGVMREKDQDSNYDGQDIGKVFIPFTAIMKDFPNQYGPAWAVDRLIATPNDLSVHVAGSEEFFASFIYPLTSNVALGLSVLMPTLPYLASTMGTLTGFF